MITRRKLAGLKAEILAPVPDNKKGNFLSLDFGNTTYTISPDSFHRVHEIPHLAESQR
jgi:hypothetical protein